MLTVPITYAINDWDLTECYTEIKVFEVGGMIIYAPRLTQP